MSSQFKVLSAGAIAAACWGGATVLSKSMLAVFPPLLLLVFQLLCSNLLLWGMLAVRRSPLPSLRQVLRLGLAGLLQPGLAYTAGIVGLALTTASVEALLWATETLVTIALAWVLLGERMPRSQIGLAVVGAIGVGLVNAPTGMTTGQSSGQSSIPLAGSVLIFTGICCAALYTIATRRMVQYCDPLLLISCHQFVGLMAASVIWLLSRFWIGESIAVVSVTNWILAAVSGLMAHAIPFWIYTTILKDVSASFAALFLILVPVFAIAIAALFLQETLTLTQWLGAGLILLVSFKIVN